VPPPHTIKSLGKFDFQAGPHIFPDTSVYEAHYLHSTPVPQLPPSGSNQPPASTWQTASSFRAPTYTPYFPYAASATPSATPYPTAQRASTPLVSAVASETPITPALINRVNDAAATDPILANFLQLAASGRATSDQLKTLALLIQSLASAQSSSMTRSALSGISGSEPHSIFNLLSGQTSSSTPSTSTLATPPSSATYSYPSSDQPPPAQTTSVPTGSQPQKNMILFWNFQKDRMTDGSCQECPLCASAYHPLVILRPYCCSLRYLSPSSKRKRKSKSKRKHKHKHKESQSPQSRLRLLVQIHLRK
jgi:hypothetical protein